MYNGRALRQIHLSLGLGRRARRAAEAQRSRSSNLGRSLGSKKGDPVYRSGRGVGSRKTYHILQGFDVQRFAGVYGFRESSKYLRRSGDYGP